MKPKLRQKPTKKLRQKDAFKNVKEVFEHHKYETLSRKWKYVGLFFADDPSIMAPDLFDPAIQHEIPNSRWNIDFSVGGIDADGWTYGKSFESLAKNGGGDAKSGWNSKARRRKWKYIERAGGGTDSMNGIRARQASRQASNMAKAQQSVQAEKIGFVPRAKGGRVTNVEFKASGHVHANKDDETLDEESKAGLERLNATDREIDDMVDEVSGQLDRLHDMAGAFNEEIRSQTAQTQRMEEQLGKATAKQAVVNARAKRLLR